MNREKFKTYLSKNGLTQDMVSKKSGIHKSVVSRMMNYDRNITTKIASKIVKGLELDPKVAVEIFLND